MDVKKVKKIKIENKVLKRQGISFIANMYGKDPFFLFNEER